jgi:flavin reductase (DIM6/NTAB) family NADH-FMN oxidoreductase RutF
VPQPERALDRQAFFEVMASFPSGVAVVTTVDADGTPFGLTTTAVASVSADPPTLLVCVDLGSRTLPVLRSARRFVVNFMRAGRSELCLLFASKADDKFSRVAWRRTESGLPLLEHDALAWAEAATQQELVIGDHVVLIASVDAGAALGDGLAPLMYYRRSWGVWTPAHETDERPQEMQPIEVGARDLRWRGAEL